MRHGTINCSCGTVFYFESAKEEILKITSIGVDEGSEYGEYNTELTEIIKPTVSCIQCGKQYDITNYPRKPETLEILDTCPNCESALLTKVDECEACGVELIWHDDGRVYYENPDGILERKIYDGHPNSLMSKSTEDEYNSALSSLEHSLDISSSVMDATLISLGYTIVKMEGEKDGTDI